MHNLYNHLRWQALNLIISPQVGQISGVVGSLLTDQEEENVRKMNKS